MRELQSVKGQYRALGIQLDILPSQIDAWEDEYRRADTILEKIISHMLNNKDNPLEILCSALNDINQTQLALRLRNIFELPKGINNVSLFSRFFLLIS